MSAYFGGRAEVHIRRQITRVVHTDFLSMYPTVCTLMGLWNFVRANGVTHHDDTSAVTALLAQPGDELVEELRTKDRWKDLASLVQVRPERDLFPVRARYPGGDTLNIGLNYLSSDEPQWFTLADVIASKVLTGKTPEVIKGLRFRPKAAEGPQADQHSWPDNQPRDRQLLPATDHSSERDQSQTGDRQRARQTHSEERRASHQNSRQRDQLWDFRRVERGRIRQNGADGRLCWEAATVPFQIKHIRKARRVLSPLARNADHGRGATDVGPG
jgi:hypothetical protein